MSAALAWIVGILSREAFSFVTKLLENYVAYKKSLSVNHTEAENQAAQDVKPLQEAQTSEDPKQVSDAIKDSLSHF